MDRLGKNTYVGKLRNIFCVWADYIKKEKNAVNVIGAIARRNLRMEVFTRIRLVARENYLDDRAYKIMNNYFRLMKMNMLAKSFRTWRTNSYFGLVDSMNKKKEELVMIEQS
mmetsp:Transcript_39161/g.37511  ORF Transcript_39161/g.37511 Transcript_39161/m.37511 type:complete len:112 (+) Transcript_39161:122-457(+)